MSALIDKINETLAVIKKKTNKNYEVGIILGTGLGGLVKDISIEKVNGFIKKIEQRTQNKTDFKGLVFLSKLEFIRNNQLSFGAYLLFVKGYCLISDVQVGRFKSETKIILYGSGARGL